MADTDWGAFTDVATLLDTDILLALRGAGGVNIPGSALIKKDGNGHVGIGTAATGRLDIAQTSRVRWDLSSAIAKEITTNLAANAYAAKQSDAESHKFYCSGTERLGIHGNGSVGIGTPSPTARLHISDAADCTVRITSASSGSAWLAASAPNGLIIINETNTNTSFGTNGVSRWAITNTGHLVSLSDNGYDVGGPSNRVRVVYAGTGTINTSDAREKHWLTVSEDRRAKDRRIARAIFDELGWFQWKDAVAEKGEDGARWHFGPRAQHVWKIVADEGLAPPLVGRGSTQRPDPDWTGPTPPAWLCFDEWPEEHGTEATFSKTLVDEDGKPLQTGTKEVVTRKAGNRFGLRVDQLGLLLDWSLHERDKEKDALIADLDARLAALEAA